MTSEVVVMNKLAVALAADSAVTAAGYKKVYNSANKLFMLCQHHPVGIMIYHNSSLMSLPWETIIKEFRAQLPKAEMSQLEDYGDAFIKYVEKMSSVLFGRDIEKRYYLDLVEAIFDEIFREIKRKLDAAESAFSDPTGNADVLRSRIYSETIDEYAEHWSALPLSETLDADAGRDLANECSAEVSELTARKFKLPNPKLGADEVVRLRQLAIDLVEKEDIPRHIETGIVVAGFGKNDFFPVLQVFQVGDVYGGKLKLRRLPVVHIKDDVPTHVEVFADSDTAKAFLKGIPPEFERKIIEWAYETAEQLSDMAVDGAVGMAEKAKAGLAAKLHTSREQLLDDFVEKIEQHKEANYVWQVEDAIVNLPKDELAQVAAALVNINLLKKRMSMALETVGGPIDVAVISKGDGFIWIDRKHYFSASKNPQFLRNRYGQSALAVETGDA